MQQNLNEACKFSSSVSIGDTSWKISISESTKGFFLFRELSAASVLSSGTRNTKPDADPELWSRGGGNPNQPELKFYCLLIGIFRLKHQVGFWGGWPRVSNLHRAGNSDRRPKFGSMCFEGKHCWRRGGAHCPGRGCCRLRDFFTPQTPANATYPLFWPQRPFFGHFLLPTSSSVPGGCPGPQASSGIGPQLRLYQKLFASIPATGEKSFSQNTEHRVMDIPLLRVCWELTGFCFLMYRSRHLQQAENYLPENRTCKVRSFLSVCMTAQVRMNSPRRIYWILPSPDTKGTGDKSTVVQLSISLSQVWFCSFLCSEGWKGNLFFYALKYGRP